MKMLASIRPFRDEDLKWAHQLNEDHAVELSSLTEAEFLQLVTKATYARFVDDEAAQLIAYDQDGDYGGINFSWFRKHLPHFIYVDRIVVAGHAREKGLARKLYENLFAFAQDKGYPCVVCEVNSEPPNPKSDAFHASLGFVVIDEVELVGKGKCVRYMKKEI